METVSLPEVAHNWLRHEERKPYREFSLDGGELDWRLVGDRFCQCPFQAAFVWRYDVSWYRGSSPPTGRYGARRSGYGTRA